MTVDDLVKLIDALAKLAGVLVWPGLLTYVLVRHAPALKLKFAGCRHILVQC